MAQTAKTIEFFFDIGSGASYLAYTQLPKLLARSGADIAYRPMLLGAVFKAVANPPPPRVKALHARHDFARFARRYGVPLVHNPFFPVNTLQMMRAGVAAQESGCLLAYLDLAFAGMWVEARDMGDAAILRATLEAGGLDAAALLALAATQPIKDRLKANTDEAVARGVFGAPSFFVGEEMFWGQDRMDFVEQAARDRGPR